LCYILFSGKTYSTEHHFFNPIGLRNHLANPKDSASASDSTDDDVKKRSYAIGLEGANDKTNYGLRDPTQKLPYLEPSFTYSAKSGFYIEAGDQYLLLKKGGGFDVFNLNPGWNIDLSGNTTLNFSGQYYHFRDGKNKSVQLIESSLAEDLASYIEEDIGNLTGKFTAAYNFYTQVPNQPKTPGDIIFTPDANYDFIIHFGEKSKLTFTPEAYLDFGTRNFYTNYLNAKANDSAANGENVKKKSYAGNSNSSFGFLDYDFELSITYKLGKFELEPQLIYCRSLYTPEPKQPNKPSYIGSITLTYTITSKK
jgi:type 1 fimbria pilin